MVEPAKVLALVPARGGSKSIPGKNMRDFGGHPLLAYSIAAGLQAESVGRVIVSTDDPQIAEIARRYGAETPFLRPSELAQDTTTDLPVFQHALDWLAEQEGYRPEYVVQLRPTSPLRPPDCVDRALAMLAADPRADSLRGVVPSSQNPYKMWRLSEDGGMRPLLDEDFDEPYNMPRQALPATYWQTGHIDALRSSTVIEKGSMSGERILPLILDARYSVDIDTLRDWQRAEWLLAQGELPFVRPGPARRPLPARVALVVLDFDGTLTDDRVWVDAEGRELVAAHRGDGMGLERLRQAGVEALVISKESNPVVAARCRKLNLPVVQGVDDKRRVLLEALQERGVDPAAAVFVGNDVNDVPCFSLVGCALVVADAHPEARRAADIVLTRPGGHGAVRELCDRIIELHGEDKKA